LIKEHRCLGQLRVFRHLIITKKGKNPNGTEHELLGFMIRFR